MSSAPPRAPDEGPWATSWLDLLDPFNGSLCPPVIIKEDFFEHAIDRHASEPFADLFGTDLADAFRGCFRTDYPLPQRHATLADCSRLLERETRLTLNEGLVLAYDVAPADKAPFTTWTVLLACAAVVILRRYPEVLSLRTLYFSRGGLGRRSSQARYRGAVARLVSRYAWMNVELNAIAPPPPHHTVEAGGQVRRNIRFNRLTEWGFAVDLDGQPWRGRPLVPTPAPEDLELRPRFRPTRRERWRQS
jgi:hypothetical protein